MSQYFGRSGTYRLTGVSSSSRSRFSGASSPSRSLASPSMPTSATSCPFFRCVTIGWIQTTGLSSMLLITAHGVPFSQLWILASSLRVRSPSLWMLPQVNPTREGASLARWVRVGNRSSELLLVETSDLYIRSLYSSTCILRSCQCVSFENRWPSKLTFDPKALAKATQTSSYLPRRQFLAYT